MMKSSSNFKIWVKSLTLQELLEGMEFSLRDEQKVARTFSSGYSNSSDENIPVLQWNILKQIMKMHAPL